MCVKRSKTPSQLEAAGKPVLAAPYLDLETVIARARRQRNEELSRLFGRLLAWLEAAIENARKSDVERFLSRATDHADLERRMREIEQGRNALTS
jgi:Protein of unknown function (DUF3563)